MKWHMLEVIHSDTYNNKVMERTQGPINRGMVQPHNFKQKLDSFHEEEHCI